MVIWLWINTYRYSLLGDEHPFATYFDVHQGYKVFTHCHMFGVSYQSCLEMLGGLEWLCLKICYPQFQWIMITIPIKNGPSDGIYLIFRHTHMRMGQNLLFPFWVNKQPLYFTVLLSLVIYHPSNVPIIRKKITRAFRPLPLGVLQPQTERRGDVAGCRCSKDGPIFTEYVKTKIG